MIPARKMEFHNKIIGIVGGVGTAAGIDLAQKICNNTLVKTDQDHLPFILVSIPELIEDRTEFLEGRISINPAKGIFEAVRILSNAGANIIGIPCNTAYVPKIFDKLIEMIRMNNIKVNVVNMIRETINVLDNLSLLNKNVGILTTKGSYKFKLYENYGDQKAFSCTTPSEDEQDILHEAIYNPEWGIKAISDPVSNKAKYIVDESIIKLNDAGAEVVILGCSELPLAVDYKKYNNIKLIDPTEILARKLISLSNPNKLKPK